MIIESIEQEECAQDGAEFKAEALPHLEKLFCVAAWLTQNRADAEMLVQQTLTHALDSIDELEGETNACVWLVRIMYEIKSKPHRAWWSWGNRRTGINKSDAGHLAAAAAFEPPTPQDFTEKEILSALRTLPSEFQEVVLLSDVEFITYKEVAEILGITVAVVMMRLSHARLLLRANLRDCSNGRWGKSDGRITRGYKAE